MTPAFRTKEAARKAVWDALERAGVAAFPFPPHGRIPNFIGAAEAARRLFTLPLWRRVRRLKINPDAPQRPVREAALRRGITLYVPTPRLRGGFMKLDPGRIPSSRLREAAALSHAQRWAEVVRLEDMPPLDAIVCGSVAVTADGRRCGKGEGYSDLEYGILRELGQPAIPILTTVHPLQIVGGFPRASTDLPLSYIVTPTSILRVRRPAPRAAGIRWSALTDADFERMPLLREARDLILSRPRRPGRRSGRPAAPPFTSIRGRRPSR